MNPIKCHSQKLLMLQKREAASGKYVISVNGNSGLERSVYFHRTRLDAAIREQHIAACPFAKEHRHPVGLVEQLEPAHIRLAKEIAADNGRTTLGKV